MITVKAIKPIYGENLSQAWAYAFVKSYEAPGGKLSPGIVSFKVNDKDKSWSLETQGIRQALEMQLEAFDIYSANQSIIETVAGTIFPESIWRRCHGDRERLFEKYEKMWPLVRKHRQNNYGTYFRRLTAFGPEKINQLKEIINTWNKGIHRHSALQAGIFDPSMDHRGTPYQGFPCLQQVVFSPIGPKGRDGMSVVAFYANQLLLRRAYGNYLGLYRLGNFMAGQMGMTLHKVTCIASDLSRSYKHNKSDFTLFADKLREELACAK